MHNVVVKKWLIVIVVVLGLYALLWSAYGLEYWHARNSVIRHYGGVGIECTSIATPPGRLYFGLDNSYSWLTPFVMSKNFTYGISTKAGGIANGYVSRTGKVTETSTGFPCTLQ